MYDFFRKTVLSCALVLPAFQLILAADALPFASMLPAAEAHPGIAAAIVVQKAEIKGKVVDKDGFPLPGVGVVVKGKHGQGTLTDKDGNYSIRCDREDVLEISCMGFQTLERKAYELDKVTVTLQENAMTLDEVQVVAFGKQKKESIVSSITAITPGDLRIPSSNITTAFAGRMAGVIAYQRSGEPGLDNAEFFIRGVTSFSTAGKKDPLILIDGIEMNSSDLSRLNVDDIASFSVMKDANAAALYGARGANGVILVTTKEGSPDKISINVRADLSSSSNTKLVELADPVTYMILHNEAVRTRDAMVELPYSSSKIRETALGTNPLRYPSVDWYHYMLKNHTNNQRVNMNITGGGKAVQYYLAASYTHDTGIIKESSENMLHNNIDLGRFQLRSNVTIKFSPRTTGIVRAYGTFDDQTGPIQGGKTVFKMARNANPVLFLPYYPKDKNNQSTNHLLFGMADELGTYTNPFAEVSSGFSKTSKSMMLMQLEFEHKFAGVLEGLFAKAIYNIKRNSSYVFTRSYNPFYYYMPPTLDNSYQLVPLNPDTGTEYLTYKSGDRTVGSAQYGELRIGYNKLVSKKHDFNVLLVGTIREEENAAVLTLSSSQQLQASLPLRNISTAGRFAYGYDSRYFAEFNFGYNGTERFAKRNRFGFFPSVGFGWMVSNEPFMAGLKDVFTTLKLKATYGKVGNDQIGSSYDRFFYLSEVEMNGVGYWFGTDRKYRTGITIGRYANDKITWEIATKTNFGLELGLFKDLTILADYFTEKRENILQTRADIPTTMGLRVVPQSNVGTAKGKGFEMELKYQKNFSKDFWTVVNGNFTYATSRFKKYEEPDYSDVPWRSNVGQKLNQPRGYIAERLFIDEEEVHNSPIQTFGEYGAGDIKYKDINKDGKITSDDMVPIGFPTVPEIIYGAGFSLGYKAFDVSCFFQGSARSSFFIDVTEVSPFLNKGQRALLKCIADDHWSENNRDLYAFWPRLSEKVISNNAVPSTHWLQNGSFVRLKSAEFGYTLPTRLLQRFHVHSLRFYVSGTNLFVWSKFKLWDPEMAGNGLGYPVQRVINLGLNFNL
ncbi:MAG: TonB-dependent receptor [Bacteroidales bacterium]|nr:TonB-dependent receptor [Bacteroidales bacterium]MDY6002304.1 TonB-dependent receptor [Candidatus Cryptobacteroides sp.]